MSTRQNKKQRKGRNNASNRERTVTTLTGDPSTPYLNPPAGDKAPMSTSFSGNAGGGGSGKIHSLPMGPQAYQMQSSFGYGYPQSFMQNMQQQSFQPQQQQPQQQFYSPTSEPQQPPAQMLSDVPLPPGKNDLEILQNLKKMILDNQHPFYKAIPSPAYLASLWKGTLSTQSQQTAKGSEQTSSDHRSKSNEGQTPTHSSTGFNGDRRLSRHQMRERRPSAGGNQQNNPGQGNRYNAAPAGNAVSNVNGASLNISKDSHVPSSAGTSLESRLSAAPAPSTSSGTPQDVSDDQRQGRYDYTVRSRSKDDYDSMNVRPGASGYHDTAKDVSMDGKAPMYGVKDEMSRSNAWVPRDAARPRPDRSYDSERAITLRPQAAGGATNDSRPLGAPGRGAGPPVDDRNRDRGRKEGWLEHDPRVDYDLVRDARLIQERMSAQYGPAPARSSPAEAPVPVDTRRTSEIPPAGDIRPPVDSRPPPDARPDLHAAPVRAAERVVTDNNEDIGSSRSSSALPPDAPALPPALGPVSSAVPADNPVGEPPSLKDRISPPSSHQLGSTSQPPVPAAQQPQPQPPVMHSRSGKPQKFQKDRGPGPGYNGGHPPYDAPHRGGDRGYHRPPTPPGPPPVSSGGPIPPHRAYDSRSASVDRPRAAAPPSGSPASRGPPSREYRGPPGRDLSRPAGQSYRPDYHDDPRYDPRYEGRPYRDYSPPPPPLPLTSARGPPPGVESAPSSRADYYPPRGRGWEEDDYYKSRGWDGPPPSGERGRYERDYPPPRTAGWDARDREYDPRDVYPPGPSGPPYDDRYVPGPPADRGRPPPGGYNAPYNRVRPRSPSPIRRGPGPVDDSRPPLKRAREDYPLDYYTPSGGGRRPSDYPGPPPRSGSPGAPPPSSGWGGPPPPPPTSGSSAGAMSVGPPHSHPPPGDRDYRPSMDYGPPPGGYDRPRSPGPPGPPGGGGRMPYSRGGGGYGRGGEPRDRGGYGMPRP